MITRRDAVSVLASISVGALISKRNADLRALSSILQEGPTPPLAPGAPNSPERLALIDAFKTQSDGIDQKFEARTHKGTGSGMPYRLFRPRASGKLPLVVYLHGSGGLGDDNLKQLGLGNIFGTRVWLLSENQKQNPCYVLAPQTDRGWSKYDFAQDPAQPILVSSTFSLESRRLNVVAPESRTRFSRDGVVADHHDTLLTDLPERDQ